MGNRVYLYNVSHVIPAPYLMLESRDDAPAEYQEVLAEVRFGEVGDTNNTGIPVPWMLYFGQEDFRTARVALEDEDEEPLLRAMPSTSVARAKERMLAALPVYERLAGDPVVAKQYWQEALDLLDKMPLPYLALEHLEWVECSDEMGAEIFQQAYEGGVPSDEDLMEQSCYTEGVQPYSNAEWDTEVTCFDFDNARQMNAIAMGYGHSLVESLQGQQGVGEGARGLTIDCKVLA